MVIERHPLGGTPAETAKQMMLAWRMPQETLLALLTVVGSSTDDFEAGWQAFLTGSTPSSRTD